MEKDVEQHLVKQCKARGWTCWKFTSLSQVGVPDRMVLQPGGRITFVETKSNVGRLSKMQVAVINKLRALGFTVLVLNSKEAVNEAVARLSENSNPVDIG
jgi:hypothetical protein